MGLILLIILILLLLGAFSSVGLQPELGLWSKRRLGASSGDRHHPPAFGAHPIWLLMSSSSTCIS